MLKIALILGKVERPITLELPSRKASSLFSQHCYLLTCENQLTKLTVDYCLKPLLNF